MSVPVGSKISGRMHSPSPPHLRASSKASHGSVCVSVRTNCNFLGASRCAVRQLTHPASCTAGKQRQARPLSFSRRKAAAQRSSRVQFWLWRAVARCGEGGNCPFVKYGGLATSKSKGRPLRKRRKSAHTVSICVKPLCCAASLSS